MKYLQIFTIFLLIFATISCSKENVGTDSLDNLTIKSGQSFGFCVGKCYSEITITGKKVTLVVKETSSKGNSNIKNEFTFTDELTDKQVSDITTALDLTRIYANPEVLGCPDCADGGAEWIEIQQKESTKKITFEYGKDIPKLEKIVNLLREERNALLTKFVKE
jgi:hypothetical protein